MLADQNESASHVEAEIRRIPLRKACAWRFHGAYRPVMATTFDRAMQMMRKRNPQTQEEGFAMLKPVALDPLFELIEAFETEQDHGLKCWLLELIGLARFDEASKCSHWSCPTETSRCGIGPC